jgi:hypothetical protein
MPTKLNEAVTGAIDLIFPDDATGTYRLAEDDVYEAEEVQEELGGDMPKHGQWIPVVTERDRTEFLTAPSGLISELVKADVIVEEQFKIESMVQYGSEPNDPYEVTVSYPDRKRTEESQTALGDD